ncbi:hypothetical protein [Zoogloea sp.]|uniref:hypothetical protein n=1 Tax=Zoogloea sp. TaxID=49181 RepID=UPI0035AF4DB0
MYKVPGRENPKHPMHFTLEAEVIWAAVPKSLREDITLKTWCRHCELDAPLCEYGGVMKGRALVLKGRCGFCIRRINQVIDTFLLPIPDN